MPTLTGFVVATTSGELVPAVRAAYLAAGYREDPAGTLRVRVGLPVDGHALITDSSIVTFDATVARTLAAASRGALFAVRDYGYRNGKRVEKAAFLPLDGRTRWARKPKRAAHPGDVQTLVAALDLWPDAWDVESRPGTTLVFAPPATSSLFPPRDTADQQAAAHTQRQDEMLASLRVQRTEQGPPDGACQTLKIWLPASLPAHTEAVLACITDEVARAPAWRTVAREAWSHALQLTPRDAAVLWELGSRRANDAIERGVLALCSHILGHPLDTRDDARLAAAHIAVGIGRLDLLDALGRTELAALARTGLGERDGANAAALIATLDPAADLSSVSERAARDRAFASTVGMSRTLSLAVVGLHAAALALFDAVQPHLASHDSDHWAHANALWATYASLGTPAAKTDTERARRRLVLALERAATHPPTLHNAGVLATALGDTALVEQVAALRPKKHAARRRKA